MWELVKDESISPAVKKVSLSLADHILGLGLGEQGPSATLKVIPQDELPEGIRALLEAREALKVRAAKAAAALVDGIAPELRTPERSTGIVAKLGANKNRCLQGPHLMLKGSSSQRRRRTSF